jgi:hypothetical protein
MKLIETISPQLVGEILWGQNPVIVQNVFERIGKAGKGIACQMP